MSNNDTVTQSDNKAANETRTVRIREDVWEAARLEAFTRRTSIVAVLDQALRNHFHLPSGDVAAA